MDTRDTGRMTPAPESPDAARDAGHPENCEHWCPRCGGEGTIEVYENGGPDARLVAECCPHCDGIGTLYGAYKALAAQVQREHTKYLQVSGKLYFMEPTITRLTAERDAALRDAERYRWLRGAPDVAGDDLLSQLVRDYADKYLDAAIDSEMARAARSAQERGT